MTDINSRRDDKVSSHYMIALIVLGLVVGQCTTSSGCDETITIDSVDYVVPDVWCGHAIDSSLVADPTTLVRLPERLSLNDYRIYVSAETHAAFVAMADSAGLDSIFFQVKSGYRSVSYQKQIIRRRMDEGKSIEEILRYVAPPGYSEHSTGRAVDLVTDEAPFQSSRAYQWLFENADSFGFYETYPKNEPDSLPWEPWHWRWGRQLTPTH